MNDESGRMWKEVLVSEFEVLARRLAGGATTVFSHDIRHPTLALTFFISSE
jgi:hypothetical protein